MYTYADFFRFDCRHVLMRFTGQVLAALIEYCSTPLADILARGASVGQAEQDGEPEPLQLQQEVLRLFRATVSGIQHGSTRTSSLATSPSTRCSRPAQAQLVPAYNMLLSDASVAPETITSIEDFRAKVPLIDKTYMQQYSLPQRCIGGAIAVGDVDFCHVSSGSSGEPTFWARSALSEIAIATRFEQILLDSFGCSPTRSILCVNVFPLGSWVGGIFTTFCLRYCSLKGLNLTLVTPGSAPPEILRCVRQLGPLFARTCILGYPPFVKGLIDAGRASGVNWAALDVCMVLAGEVFSEEWRQLVGLRAGVPVPLRDIVSIYGTADAGVLGSETWLSASVRAWLAERPATSKELFGKERLPTLVQYDPAVRYLEVTPQQTIVLTTMESLCTRSPPTVRDRHAASDGTQLCGPPPLLRYHIHDRGGTMAYATLLEFLTKRGFELPTDVRDGHVHRRLPFAWVFGREHWAISLYGANVFVDQIMSALEAPSVAEKVTGKFILDTQTDADANPRVWLSVECAPAQQATDAELVHLIQERVLAQLLRVNSEFANYVPSHSQAPMVSLFANGDPAHFPVGVKHKWTR